MSQREIECPYCTGKILAKTGGRAFATIEGFLQRNFSIRIPTSIISYLKENTPITTKSALKGKCAACNGKGTIKDPSDDSKKYQQVKDNFQKNAKEIEKNEALLAPPCGNRYTIIQGSDLLEVGIGMNDTPSYRVEKDKGVRNSGLIDPKDIKTNKAGPQFPSGGKANHVQGLNVPASPGGHYVIKCSNKFSLLVGAQGIDITTGGPVNIHGGITQIIGPEVTVGSKTGRLVLEGDVVNINGKSVEVTPNDGHLFVKGTISNTGNIMVGGHMHAESISFTRAECTGKNETSKISAPADLMTGPAFWGGPALEALPNVLKDLVQNASQNAAEPKFAQQLITPRGTLSISEKVSNIAYCSLPTELRFTGYIMPGTLVGQAGPYPCIATAPVPLFNFPHTHALPDLRHTHESRVPDLEYSSDTAQEVRSKQGGIAGPAPLHKQSTKTLDVFSGLFGAIGSAFVAARTSTQNFLYSKKLGG